MNREAYCAPMPDMAAGSRNVGEAMPLPPKPGEGARRAGRNGQDRSGQAWVGRGRAWKDRTELNRGLKGRQKWTKQVRAGMDRHGMERQDRTEQGPEGQAEMDKAWD